MKQRDNDAFGRRLRDAGAALTPAASEPLHARVMADVRRERAAAATAAPPTDESARRRWWMVSAAAAAAAIITVVWVTTSRHAEVAPARNTEVTQLPTVPSLDVVVVEAVQPMRAKLHAARFAYLDRDTKRLARFLLRSVPGVTTAEGGVTPSSASGT